MRIDADDKFIIDSIFSLLVPPVLQGVAEWARENVRLPSDTSEPGYYNPDRAPYQQAVLEAAGPESPARDIVMVFGSQMGKTLCEQLVMLYNIAANPRPQAFAFSTEGELKQFVKMKFNPLLISNPAISDMLGVGTFGSGNTMTEKQYAGGFLRFVYANVESNLRSYSVETVVMDEVDTYPTAVGRSGDPVDLMRDRQRTFEGTRKMILSSTPTNTGSKILDRLKRTTDERYQVPCPHCHGLFVFEWEYMHWRTGEGGESVESAWMECPHCHEKIWNSDKTWMLDPANGAGWIATNPKAPSTSRGFFISTLYAPVGWTSWQDLAQLFVDACNASTDQREAKLVSFYNTNLCRQYSSGAEDLPTPDAVEAYAMESKYRRGVVPAWVGVITTGSDVQKNRIETTIMGWGKRGRNIVIDHVFMDAPPGEETEDIDCECWSLYVEEILEGRWRREDGLLLGSIANGLDRSYNSTTVDSFYERVQSGTLHPIRGIDGQTRAKTEIPEQRQAKNGTKARYWDTPVSELKRIVYGDLTRTMKSIGTDTDPYRRCFFPNDLSHEFYEQMLAERYVEGSDGRRGTWEKIRDRNEVLDTRVYNYAMMYLSRLHEMSDEEWDDLFEQQRQIMKEGQRNVRKKRRRQLSSGVVL